MGDPTNRNLSASSVVPTFSRWIATSPCPVPSRARRRRSRAVCQFGQPSKYRSVTCTPPWSHSRPELGRVSRRRAGRRPRRSPARGRGPARRPSSSRSWAGRTASETSTNVATRKLAATRNATSAPWTKRRTSRVLGARRMLERRAAGGAEHRDQHGEPERAADLLHDVDQPGRRAGVARRDPGQRRPPSAGRTPCRCRCRRAPAARAATGTRWSRDSRASQSSADGRHGEPATISVPAGEPRGQHAGAELRGTRTAPRSAAGTPSPATSGRVAEHVLQELGQEEEHPEHAGHQQQPGDVRDAAAAVGEQPQRRDRRAARASR